MESVENKKQHIEEEYKTIERLNKEKGTPNKSSNINTVTGDNAPDRIMRDLTCIIDQLVKLSFTTLDMDDVLEDGEKYAKESLYEYDNDDLPDLSLSMEDAKLSGTGNKRRRRRFTPFPGRKTDNTILEDFTNTSVLGSTATLSMTDYASSSATAGFDITAAVKSVWSPKKVFAYGKWNRCVPWLFANQKNLDPDAGSHGVCAGCVRQFLEAGGIDSNGRPHNGWEYDNWLLMKGFNHVSNVTGGYDQNIWTAKYARPGDIAVMNYKDRGHICMYDGHNWISDFRQHTMSPYPTPVTCRIYRYSI